MSQRVEVVSNLRVRKNLPEGSTHGLPTLTFVRTFRSFTSGGKLGECSDESVPMNGNWAQGSDMKEFLCPVPLVERKLRCHTESCVVRPLTSERVA